MASVSGSMSAVFIGKEWTQVGKCPSDFYIHYMPMKSREDIKSLPSSYQGTGSNALIRARLRPAGDSHLSPVRHIHSLLRKECSYGDQSYTYHIIVSIHTENSCISLK